MDRKVPQHESRQGELPAEPCMGHFGFTSEAFIRLPSCVCHQYLKACPIRGSAGSSPCLDSCCGTLRSMLPHSMLKFGCIGVI